MTSPGCRVTTCTGGWGWAESWSSASSGIGVVARLSPSGVGGSSDADPDPTAEAEAEGLAETGADAAAETELLSADLRRDAETDARREGSDDDDGPEADVRRPSVNVGPRVVDDAPDPARARPCSCGENIWDGGREDAGDCGAGRDETSELARDSRPMGRAEGLDGLSPRTELGV